MANSRNYSNTAVSTTLNGSITNVGTSVVLTSQTGMPTPPFLLALEPDTASEELVLVTSGSGTGGSPYVVTRGQDGTANVAHTSLVSVQHRVAAVDFTDSRTHEAASANIHGLNGSSMSVNGGTAGLTSSINLNTSVAETTVSKSFSIAGNSMAAGSMYRLTAFGTLTSLTATTPNIIWKLKYGSVVVATFTTTTSAATASDWRLVGEFAAQVIGGSGSVTGAMTLWAPTLNSAFTVANCNPTDTQGLIGSTSTTSTQSLLLTAQWSASSVSNAIVTLGSNVEQLF